MLYPSGSPRSTSIWGGATHMGLIDSRKIWWIAVVDFRKTRQKVLMISFVTRLVSMFWMIFCSLVRPLKYRRSWMLPTWPLEETSWNLTWWNVRSLRASDGDGPRNPFAIYKILTIPFRQSKVRTGANDSDRTAIWDWQRVLTCLDIFHVRSPLWPDLQRGGTGCFAIWKPWGWTFWTRKMQLLGPFWSFLVFIIDFLDFLGGFH